MSKLSFEQSSTNCAVKPAQNGSTKARYRTLAEEGASQSLVRELNKVFVQREQPIEKAFEILLDSIAKHSECVSNDTLKNMSAILARKLRENQASQTDLVNILVATLDDTILSNYIKGIIQREIKNVTQKSPFRMALEKLYHRWVKILKETQAPYNVNHQYDELALRDREAQLELLRHALEKQHKYEDSNDEKCPIGSYPDDELVATIEAIIDTSKTYYYMSTVYPHWQNGFKYFIDELKDINSKRISCELIAHEHMLVSQVDEILAVLKSLNAENSQRPYAHQMFNIMKALVLQQTKSTYRHNQQVSELKDQVKLLTDKLDSVEGDDELLDEIQSENDELRQQILQLEQQVSELKKRINNVGKTEKPINAPSLKCGPFSASFG